MSISRIARRAAVLLATLNWLIPISQVHAFDPPTDPQSSAPATRAVYVNDIALGNQGELLGYVYDSQGQPQQGIRVNITRTGQQPVTVVSDRQGRFQITGLRGGTFQVAAGRQIYLCRGWAAGTAPPKARDRLLVVSDGIVQRGQRPIGDLFRSDPIMVGLVLAAAIAIPIAISNSKDSSPAGS